MDYFGYLSVLALNAQGAYPVAGALIKVESDDEYDRIEVQTSLTDGDGKSEIFILPTPPRSLSETPSPSSEPMSLYKVSVLKEGFYPRELNNISMFEGVYSTLTVSLVPVSLYDEQENQPKKIENSEGSELFE